MRKPNFSKLIPPSLQYIKTARVVLDSLDPYSVGAKQWLTEAFGNKLQATNPNCNIIIDQRGDKQPSYIAVTYVNDTYKFFLAHKRTVDEIFYDMGMHVGMLEHKYNLDENEIEQEEVDDVDELKKK